MCVEIAIIGAGTVGDAVLRQFKESSFMKERAGVQIKVKWLVEKDAKKRKRFEGKIPFVCESVDEALSDPDVKIVVELTGSVREGKRMVVEALRRGKHVVTANKALLAEELKSFLDEARKKEVALCFEASVGAGIPLLLPITSSLSSDKIIALYGIMNGTCNYILTSMQRGATFEEALEDAKRMGVCEPDPALDINGTDTAHKLCILASLAFGRQVTFSHLYVEGIAHVKKEDIFWAEEEFGYRLKLLGIAKQENGGVQLRVHPTLIPSNSVLASVDGVYNAIYVVGRECGPLLFYGRGAGGESAATAVVSDIIQIARSMGAGGRPFLPSIKDEAQIKPISKILCSYYLRFMAVDQPGVLAQIARVLATKGISIASVIQKGRAATKVVPIVMLTHQTMEEKIQSAKTEIDELEVIKEPTVILRVEEVLP